MLTAPGNEDELSLSSVEITVARGVYNPVVNKSNVKLPGRGRTGVGGEDRIGRRNVVKSEQAAKTAGVAPRF